MKHTYLMDLKGIKESLETLWQRYQHILENPNWEDLNEARAILYLTGQVYCEQIAVGAIERRLSHLQKPLQLNEFLLLIDSESDKLEEFRSDPKFKELEDFYRIIKEYKNMHVGGKFYKDEEKFVEIYNQHAPSESHKTSYKGFIDKK